MPRSLLIILNSSFQYFTLIVILNTNKTIAKKSVQEQYTRVIARFLYSF